MSLFDGISGLVNSWNAPGRSTGAASPTTAGQQPGASSGVQPLSDKLGSVFESSFKRDFATIFDRGNAGEFDDPELRKAEDAALARFDQYAQVVAAAAPTPGVTTSAAPLRAVTSGPMANAAPGRGGPGAGPPDVLGGGGRGASAAPDPQVTAPIAGLATSEATLAARDVFKVRVRQSEARLANMSQSLKGDYPKAAQLASASTGTWDPTTFVPKTPQEAEAFAQRMVIDSTEAAARLEIVATQLDEARFEASLGTDPAAAAKVTALEQELHRQEQYFGKLAGIVERASGMFTEAGDDALAGNSLRGAGDLTATEYADRLRAAGVDEASIIRAVGAAEVGIEQVETPGGSPRLKQLAGVLSSWALDYMNSKLEQVREAGREAKAERAEERDKLEARQHAVREQHQQEQAQQAAESQQQRAERQDAEFARFLEGLRQQAAGRRDAG